MGFEYFQGQRVYNFSGQNVPVFDHLIAKKFFLLFKYICLGPLIVPIAAYAPPLGTTCEESDSVFFTPCVSMYTQTLA